MPRSTCYPVLNSEKKRQCLWLTITLVIGLVLGIIAGILGVLLGYDRSGELHDKQLLTIGKRLIRNGFSNEIVKDIFATTSASKIQEYLSIIVANPHVAGTEGDHQLATFIHDQWVDQGLDDVKLVPYEVLLSYPDQDRPNKISLHDLVGHPLYESILPSLPPNENWTSFTPHLQPYFAYSPNGIATGEPVFVNYGTEDDFNYLKKQGIDLLHKIVIAKLGKNPCDKKVSLAELHGAVGVLVYADPANVAPEGTNETSVYNYTWWLPTTAAGYATTRQNMGDPMTPGYPSMENVFRIPLEKLNGEFPEIVAQPISASVANEILKRIGGKKAPEEWKGNLDIQYRIGPGFSNEEQARALRIEVNNQLKTVTTYNVIATITGLDEPDRYVLMGNHRDAWVKGAIDPGSGTAVMMELTRTLNKIRKKGWRPRRSMMFCSWGAEEFGLIGSTEWVEEHLLKLKERAVAYINVDNCVSGIETFVPVMTPTLKDAAFKVAKLVPDPINNTESLYDSWYRNMKKYYGLDQNDIIKNPVVDAFSDFGPFLYTAGIPVMDVTWYNMELSDGIPYPAYHTAYETLYYLETFIDPDYARHVTNVQFTCTMLHLLADSNLLPFHFDALVDDELDRFKYLAYFDDQLAKVNISLSPLKQAFQDLQDASKIWKSYLENADKENPYILRSLNDHMMLMHKAFYNRVHYNDTQSWFYRYGTERSLFSILDPSPRDKGDDLKNFIKLHLSDLLIMIQQLVGMLGRNPYGI